jgi:hypothetical protein
MRDSDEALTTTDHPSRSSSPCPLLYPSWPFRLSIADSDPRQPQPPWPVRRARAPHTHDAGTHTRARAGTDRGEKNFVQTNGSQTNSGQTNSGQTNSGQTNSGQINTGRIAGTDRPLLRPAPTENGNMLAGGRLHAGRRQMPAAGRLHAGRGQVTRRAGAGYTPGGGRLHAGRGLVTRRAGAVRRRRC